MEDKPTTLANTHTKIRDNKFDSLRGFAILLVVLGHSIQYSGLDFDKNILFMYIYSFHMPLFMFISGYVSVFSNDGIKSGLKKKAIALLLPFSSWAIINFLIKAIANGRFDLENAKLFITQLIFHPDDNGLWFLWILFLINIIVYLAKLFMIGKERGLLVTWLLLNMLFVKWPDLNFFGLGLLKTYIFYYLIGILFNKYNNKFFVKINWLLYLCCLIFPFAASFWHRLSPPTFILAWHQSELITKIFWVAFQYLCGILGIGFAIILIDVLSKTSLTFSKYLRNVGTITLEMYATHFYLLGLGLYMLSINNYACKIVLVYIFTLLTSFLTIRIMKRSKAASLIFFGQNKNKIS